jgi:hypothetical protein
MIVKASDDLRSLVIVVQSPLIPIEGKAPPASGAPESLKFLMPDWMREALIVGSVLTIDAQDFCSLDPEIREHLEVLKP